jgi:hypothetical protein
MVCADDADQEEDEPADEEGSERARSVDMFVGLPERRFDRL